MVHYENANTYRTKRNIKYTIFRVLLTPIFVCYRLYLWVWDGTMSDY